MASLDDPIARPCGSTSGMVVHVSAPGFLPDWLPDDPDLAVALRCGRRLAAVAASGLLDEPAGGVPDQFARLAARLTAAPGAALVIVEPDRDRHVGRHGIGSAGTGREVRGATWCQQVVRRAAAVVVEDLQAEPPPGSGFVACEPGLRAYLGVPVRCGGQVVGALCVFDRVRRRWSAQEQEALADLAASLERERAAVGALDAAIADAAQARAIVRASESQSALLAHDLRTPLQVVQLSALLLQRRLPSTEAPVLTRVLDAVQTMREMVDQLMNDHLPEVLTDPARCTRTGSVVEATLSLMGPIAERRGVRVSAGPVEDLSLTVDESQMLRVLANLVGNAIKHGCPGTSVRIDCRSEGDRVAFTVTDDGPGMDDDDRARAFERGWQGGRSLTAGDGAGLGLSIVRAIAERHGGAVLLDSAPGRGTRVTVLLPVAGDCAAIARPPVA